MGEFAKVAFACGVIVLGEAAFQILRVADIEAPGGVLEDIGKEGWCLFVHFRWDKKTGGCRGDAHTC